MTAYSLIGIPGWETLSLAPDASVDVDRRIDELTFRAFPAELPRDSVTPFRNELHRHFSRLVEQARHAGAAELCLPTQRMGEVVIPASYSVAEFRDGQPEGDPEAMLDSIERHSLGQARRIDVGGQLALREETVAYPDQHTEEPLALAPGRQVTYTVSAPGDVGCWLIFSFITIGDGDPVGAFADLLVRLFDAHIGTLQWTS
ncbi:hypothetical protein [Cryobacterium sp. SO1]|uniref:hypothetical protein n=1 Tax=Cryobacterium sp. SO1 TaxID=1897061 RepID=UPI0010231762|nr:hypothetical protein [Cryobacterium sp. SO1]RZI34299.1 hypothetical protein BJQ95_03440 [Cryobacterium sp. SO1]